MPYWRLAAFYFFYFATLGVLIPYWSLYLRYVGFDAAEIGQLVALLLATKIVAPNIWGWVADRSGQCMRVVRLAAFLSMVAYLGVFFGTGYWWLAAVMTTFSFFWNASLPQIEATTLNHLGAAGHRYGRVRLWGSIGFIVFVTGLGPVIDQFGPRSILPAVLVTMVAIWISTLLVPESAPTTFQESPGRFVQLLRRPEVAAFLLACFLMQASHAPFYAFFSIYLTDYGYSKSIIGTLWAFGVVCEIGVFMIMHRLLISFSVSGVLTAAFAVTALRWTLVAWWPQYVIVLILTQAMHAVTFGAYHAAAIQFIHRFFRGPHQHRGQAVYSSFSFGVGGAVGSLVAGHAWGSIGPAPTFLMAALLALIAGALVLLVIRPALGALRAA